MMGTTEITIAALVAVGVIFSAMMIPPDKKMETEAVHLLIPPDIMQPKVNVDEMRLDAVQENLELQSVRIQKLSRKLDELIVVKEHRDERGSGVRR